MNIKTYFPCRLNFTMIIFYNFHKLLYILSLMMQNIVIKVIDTIKIDGSILLRNIPMIPPQNINGITFPAY